MKAVLSWIKDYVDLQGLNLEEIAYKLTMLGLEVESIKVVGLALPPEGEKRQFHYDGLAWDKEKIVVAQVNEVGVHPNADKLTLCQVDDGNGIHTVLTGAPNLWPYKGQGTLAQPLKVAYAKEGSVIYDGHQPGLVLTKLKKAVIRGVESSSMICSEKELGISEEHDGVIILDADAPTGMPLADYMGDAVFEVSTLPNMVRNTGMIGIARELAAVLKRELHLPKGVALEKGKAIEQKVHLEIQDGELNPRFMLGMVTGAKAEKSPYWAQRRIALAGMRPIDALVDATNYTMLDTGEPLHAFDYDILSQRVGGATPSIVTRTALPDEKLELLDGTRLSLEPQMVVVADSAGPLSLAGVMGGVQSGIHKETRNILLEAASWNLINIRKTCSKTHISSEASYRFSRGVHPALAAQALSLCLKRLLDWGGGELVSGVIDQYPTVVDDPTVTLTEKRIHHFLGVEIPMYEVADILTRLGFECRLEEDTIIAKAPPIRLDIEPGLIGQANLLEEISRVYGYDKIPASRLAHELPVQRGNPEIEMSDRIRQILTQSGLQDTYAYRQTSPERESLILPERAINPEADYVCIKNPITPERTVLRRTALPTMLELLQYNCKFRNGLAMFELGPVFLPVQDMLLPKEAKRLTIGLYGAWESSTWLENEPRELDFYDLKAIVQSLFDALHLQNIRFQPAADPSFHPGKCAKLMMGEETLGVMGEVHPLVKQHYGFKDEAVYAAELDADLLIRYGQAGFSHQALSSFPSMNEDIAVIVAEELPAAELEAAIRQSGGKLLTQVKLFDIYRDPKIGQGKKSMAYQLTYQAYDRTLGVKDAETIRNRIVRYLSHQYNAVLRSA
ncbi:MAG: phenylalanine--tRNA ligase subunit beta [Anaerolineaceae bacterium]|nr:phenylalanine--tRNA ligase subunit beta [Anaerolineaceae bacterium]